MNTEYNPEFESIKKSLETTIEYKYLTKNELITLDSIAHLIEGDLRQTKKAIERNSAISQALSDLQKYMPRVFDHVLEHLKAEGEKQKTA